MDIARHGIFQPQYFHFPMKSLAILMGVMLTDVILLDGPIWLLPTSTTVSLVFELLGGTGRAFDSQNRTVGGDLTFGMLINTEKALSVITAFSYRSRSRSRSACFVQYAARLLFHIRVPRPGKYFIVLFHGASA